MARSYTYSLNLYSPPHDPNPNVLEVVFVATRGKRKRVFLRKRSESYRCRSQSGVWATRLVEELLERTEMTLLDAINVLRRGSQENNSAPANSIEATKVASTVSDDDDDFAALLDDVSGVFPCPALTRAPAVAPRKRQTLFFNVKLDCYMYLLCPYYLSISVTVCAFITRFTLATMPTVPRMPHDLCSTHHLPSTACSYFFHSSLVTYGPSRQCSCCGGYACSCSSCTCSNCPTAVRGCCPFAYG